jgi:hypothetical protein
MFESIRDQIPEIERRLLAKESPLKISRELNIPKTIIYDYKRYCFNLQGEAAKDWAEEQKKGHDERMAAGKEDIINTLELLNLAKKRAQYLLGLELGSAYKLADGEEKELSLASAALYWQQGQQMTCDIVKSELLLQGEDGVSRIADAMEEMEGTRLAILEAVDDDPEAQQKIVDAIMERRRRNPLLASTGNLG